MKDEKFEQFNKEFSALALQNTVGEDPIYAFRRNIDMYRLVVEHVRYIVSTFQLFNEYEISDYEDAMQYINETLEKVEFP